MTNLEKAKQLLEEFKVLEEELDDLLFQIGRLGPETKKFPIGGKLRLLIGNIETYDRLNATYKELKHGPKTIH